MPHAKDAKAATAPCHADSEKLLNSKVKQLIKQLPSPKHAVPSVNGSQVSFGAGELVEGSQVEYYSDSNGCWTPCVVTHLSADTGAVKLSIRPTTPLDLSEQRSRLRPRTRPSKAQLEWVRETLREGRLDLEAQVIFGRHASRNCATGIEPSPDAPAFAICLADLNAAAEELDAKLGISGSVCALRQVANKAEGQTLSLDRFSEVFWELLWGVQNDFCQALPADYVAPQCLEHPSKLYAFQQTLGTGSFGVVKLARNRATGEERAVKMIRKEDIWGSLDELKVEMSHLCLLDHPHIVRLYEYYDDINCVYLVMDYCSGGDLYALVKQTKSAQQKFPEEFVAAVMRQVLFAIAHVHARSIVHLDLKSANIMLMPSMSTLSLDSSSHGYTFSHINEKPHVMVIDLGVAQIFRPGNFKFNRPIGTPATMAPEVWKGEIHPKADIFSCGVVLFEQLSLSQPFRCPVELVDAIRYWSARPLVPWIKTPDASVEAEDLCNKMLMLARHRRPTASQCLLSPFLAQNTSDPLSKHLVSFPREMVQHLANVPKRSVLYKSVALSIARAWPANQLTTVIQFFYELDSTRSGRLSREKLVAGLERFGVERVCAREVAECMDMSRDGSVCWTEFVAGCINLGSGLYDEDLQKIFHEADGDSDGLLSQQDLSKMLPADHLREEDALCDIFADLAGRTDRGARIDWPTFRQHFSTGVPGNICVVGGHQRVASKAGSQPDGDGCILEQALGFVETARGFLWPEPTHPSQPQEEDLVQLAQMGFTDRERCKAVLQRYKNRLSNFVVEELFREAGEGSPGALRF